MASSVPRLCGPSTRNQAANSAVQSFTHIVPLSKAFVSPKRVQAFLGKPTRRVPSVVRHASTGQGSEGTSSDEGSVKAPDSLPVADADTDWREFRARLVASSNKDSSDAGPSVSTEGSWAHGIAAPEKGCLLVAHPLMFTQNQTYFFQSVIFLFQHSEESSAGLILNRPTQYTIGSVRGAEALCPEFADNTLYLGGDVGSETVHLLHTHPLEGSQEVIPGVYCGGFEAVKESVASGLVEPREVHWYTRYAGWGKGQLERECKSGVWFPAAASTDVIMRATSVGCGKDLWHEVLELMGGEFGQLSKAVRESYNADIMEFRPDEGKEM